ncbi:MAG: T9SS type A sorting domain-containing protein [Prolixibacteraceae bacterium]|nr:T9SS type A sorting domain-containing protein [Prolixibacteraceae bacterium]
MRQIFYFLIVCIFLTYSPSKSFGQTSREKMAIMEKEFDKNQYDPILKQYIGANWDEFGDLFFEKNGKQYWLATFTAVVSPNYDYYRVFEIDQHKGVVKEVTTKMLGGYYTVGAPNSPYYYEDIDNDGIKDIMVFDHGKEYSTTSKWEDYNVFFKGTPTGFVKTEIPIITTVKGYFHGHAIGDFDGDGDNDIAIGDNGVKVYKNDGKGNFTSMNVIPPKNGAFFSPFAMKFINTDDDKELELLAPPYRDFDNSCCRAQSRLLDLKNGTWDVNNFAQQSPFLNGLVSGCAQILTFPSNKRKSPDLVFRVETFDTAPNFPNGTWLTKFYRNDESRFDTIMPVKYAFADTAHIFFIDPKVADFDFDGLNDIFFKENTYGDSRRQHAVNERLWLNDGKNNFNPIPFKFSSDANKLMYLYVKTDSIKKYSLFMSLTETWKNDVKYIYSRLDSLVFPIKNKFDIETCQNESTITQITKVPVKIAITYNPKNENVITSDSTITFSPKESGLYTLKYILKNDFFESTEYEITYNIKPKPETPKIFIDNSDILVSSGLYRNRWYKDGVELSDTTQKIKPISSGIYSVKTVQNSCSSEMSSNYIYIKTAVNDLKSSEFIKVYPNPTDDNFIVDYKFNNQSILKLYFYDLSGNLLFEKDKIKDRESIKLKHYSQGTYLVVIKDNDGNVLYSNTLIKN